MQALWLWLLLINGAAFVLCGVDKWKARRGKWRVKENTLLGTAVLGGGIGLLVGMRVFHHKTLHKKFTIGVPLIVAGEAVLVLWMWFRLGRGL